MARLDRSEDGIRALSRPTKPEPEGTPLPAVSIDLLRYLEATFPDRLPPIGSAYTELERAWGRREVIEHLKGVKEQIEQDVLRQSQSTAAGRYAGPTAASPG